MLQQQLQQEAEEQQHAAVDRVLMQHQAQQTEQQKTIKSIGYVLQSFRDVFFLEVLGAAGSATHTHPAGRP